MNHQEVATLIETSVPTIIGGTLGLLAFIGIGELLKETSIALKKQLST